MDLYGNDSVLARHAFALGVSLMRRGGYSPTEMLAMLYEMLSESLQLTPQELAALQGWMFATSKERGGI